MSVLDVRSFERPCASRAVVPQELVRPDAQDEELLTDFLLPSKAKANVNRDSGAEDGCCWSALLLAALQFCPTAWSLGLSLDEGILHVECRLPKGLRPLEPYAAIDVRKLAAMLGEAAAKVAANSGGGGNRSSGNSQGLHWALQGCEALGRLAAGTAPALALHELLSALAASEAARAVRSRVQYCAVRALKTGRFRGRPLQIHHLALLEWAGASWLEVDSSGCTPLHAICALAHKRHSAPLRGATEASRLRFLCQRAPCAVLLEDRERLTAINYLLPPVASHSHCAGSAGYEMLAALWKTLLVTDGKSAKHCAYIEHAMASLHLQQRPLTWVRDCMVLEDLEQEGSANAEQGAHTLQTQLSGRPVFSWSGECANAPLDCAVAEYWLNFTQAREALRRLAIPVVHVQALRALAAARGWKGRSSAEQIGGNLQERFEQAKLLWHERKRSYEKRLSQLELELGRTKEAPSPVPASPMGVETTKARAPPPVEAAVLAEMGSTVGAAPGSMERPLLENSCDQKGSGTLGNHLGREAAEAIVKQVRQQRIIDTDGLAVPEAVREAAKSTQASLVAAVDRLAQDLYELEGHFVFELIQNADDNSYESTSGTVPRLTMAVQKAPLEDGELPFVPYFMSANNEMGLQASDVAAMCDINASSKRNKVGCLGRKGIGWKSTFAVSRCPHVLSGNFTFKFDTTGPLGKLGYVTPTWVTDGELLALPQAVRDAHREGGTVVYLPLEKESAAQGIADAFDKLCEQNVTLLFLKRLQHIGLTYPDGSQVWLRQEGSDVRKAQTSASGAQESGSDELFRYALHSFERPQARVPVADAGKGACIRLAFPLSESSSGPPPMAAHVGLPVRHVGFRFAVDAPFDLVASRGDLHEGSAVNHELCELIPEAFVDFMTGSGQFLSARARSYLGTEVASSLWQAVREKLVASLAHVACVLTEDGDMARPSECLERPHDAVGLAASHVVPPLLLELSCGRRFAASAGSGAEVLGLQHWVKMLKFRGEPWQEGLIVSAAKQQNPCDFFLPFCAWLEAELKSTEQPSELLNSLRDLDLLPAFGMKDRALRICDGLLFLRPCLQVRADWQRTLCQAGVLQILEPRVRMALQGATPHFLSALTVGMPSRSTLAAACVAWHATGLDGRGIMAEPLCVQALIASLACLKEAFLADELPDGAALGIDVPLQPPGETPEARLKWWRELGKWLWVPSASVPRPGVAPRILLRRPQEIRCCTYLGHAAVPENCVPAGSEGTVLPDILGKAWGDEAALGWETFLHGIGVIELDPVAEVAVQQRILLSGQVGASLCRQDWWSKALKLGLRVEGYVAHRLLDASPGQSAWLKSLAVTVEETPVGTSPQTRPRRSQRKVCVADHFLHDVYGRLGGRFLHYVRLPDSKAVAGTISPSSMASIRSCLCAVGVQAVLTADGLLSALRTLREAGRCQNLEVFADIYKEVSTLGLGAWQGGGTEAMLQQAFSELIFVPPQDFKRAEECTWEEEASLQWLTGVPALQTHYQRYGPTVRHFFLDILKMPPSHPGFTPSALLAALRNLVQRVEQALACKFSSAPLQGSPMTAAGLLEAYQDLTLQLYSRLAAACRRGSVTWHTDVRRAFSQERLLLLPQLSTGRSPEQQRRQQGEVPESIARASGVLQGRPKRLFSSEAWWDVVAELAETKAADLGLQRHFGKIADSDFLFLRVIGVRRGASRSDIAQRLKQSMSNPGPLSHWTEGISLADLEELEDVQTSSYFRPPGWRSPEEDEDADAGSAAQPREPAFQPPPATSGSAHPPAWRSAEAAQDAERRATAALEADAATRAAAEELQQEQRPDVSRLAPPPHTGEEMTSRRLQRETHRETSSPVEGHIAQQAVPPAASSQQRKALQPVPPAASSQRQQEHQEERQSDQVLSPPRVRCTWSRLQALRDREHAGKVADDAGGGVGVGASSSVSGIGDSAGCRDGVQTKQPDREEDKTSILQPAEADNAQSGPKLRGTRASAWATFRRLQETETAASRATRSGKAADVQEEAEQRPAEEAEAEEEIGDAEQLRARLAALEAEAEERRLEAERLVRERDEVEATKERYLRILQDFYANM